MKEPCFNCFLFIDGATGVFREVGVIRHMRRGTDQEKIEYLQARVDEDHKLCRRFPLGKHLQIRHADRTCDEGAFSFQSFMILCACDRESTSQFFEPAFEEMGAPQEPMMVITCVVDGKVQVESFMTIGGGHS